MRPAAVLLRDEGATHVGCATDRVIESFRNDLFPGYKSSAGMPPELLDQFPIAEAAVEALGIVLWPMVEFEADDAIAAAAARFGEDPTVDRILVCTPDKDMAQLVRGRRIVLWDRRRGSTYDDAGVREKWGVAAARRSRTGWPGRRLVGRLSRASPAGARSPPPPSWRGTATSRTSRRARRPGRCPGVGGTRAASLAATLRDHWDEALLYRDLARLRTADDGVPIRQKEPDELRWDGAPRAEWEAFCEEWGLARLAVKAPPLARGLSGDRRNDPSYLAVRCQVRSSPTASGWSCAPVARSMRPDVLPARARRPGPRA